MPEEQKKDRLTQLLLRRKWQIQELKVKRTTTKTGGEEENIIERRRVVRKCEFPEREEAKAIVDFLSSDACLPYLRLCGEEISRSIGEEAEGLDWVPIQAWYSEEDATNQHARKGMLYHVLKVRDNDDIKGEGPFVTHDGCKYQEEYTFFWDVDEPPEVPKGRSGVQYELDVKRREDEDGLGGLYDCILVKRTTVQQKVEAYESHKELSETRTTAQMLGVSDDSDLVDDEDNPLTDEDGKPINKSVDEKIADYVAAQNMTTEDGGGVVVDITKEKNADCTTSVTIHNTKEEETPKSTVSAEVTARYIKTVTVDENVPAEGDEEYELDPDGTPKVDDKGNKVPSKYPQVSVGGDGTVTKKTVSKTKGGLRTVQTETTTPIALAEGASTQVCERTKFEHVDTKIKEAQTAAEADQTADPSGGIYKKIQSTLRDDGLWDVQTTTTTENKVASAVKHTSKTGTQLVEDVTDKNSDETVKHAALGSGDKGVTDKAITEVQETTTPGGRKDIRTITRTPIKTDKVFVFNTSNSRRSSRTLKLRVFENAEATDFATASGAEYKIADPYTDGSIRLNEFGLYDGQLQYYDTQESSGDESDTPEFGKESWIPKLMTREGVATIGGNVCTTTETWVDIFGYKKANADEIFERFSGKEMVSISVSPSNRDRTEWSIRAESAHTITYTSTVNSFQVKVGPDPAYIEADFDWSASSSS